MQHQIHTFRAATMDEALDLIRQELGHDAVVVNSKPIESRGILPWLSVQQQVEVSAHKASSNRQVQPGKGQLKLKTLAETMSTDHVAPRQSVASERSASRLPADGLAPPPPWLEEGRLTHPVSNGHAGGVTRVEKPSDQNKLPVAANDQHLTSLQNIVTRLERHSRAKGLSDVPSEFFQHYLKLIESDVEDELARELVSKLRRHATPAALNSPSAVQSVLTALIEREIRCAAPIKPQPGRREIIAFVGPTGVGKTTTLAKLAGHLHLHQGFRIGLITLDTYRVGAIDQLKSYAEILQVPFQSATDCVELRSAIDALDDVDLILIDTAGCSPWDEAKLSELGDLLNITRADHVLLTLSLANGTKMLSQVADRFASVSPTSLVLTKLDEASAVGGLLSVAREIPYAISYFTTGQDVPNQIEPAHPTRLAKLILGHERLHECVEGAVP